MSWSTSTNLIRRLRNGALMDLVALLDMTASEFLAVGF